VKRIVSRLSLVLFGLLAIPQIARAGGYDTPILYSARHIGMAGTAISYVSDPSALFHNPAGLANIRKASVLANVSPAFGSIKATPVGATVESETTFAPFFLVGGAYRIADWATIGLAVYPVASAGGEYKYGTPTTTNSTTLSFIEASPGVGFNLPYGIKLGAGYRITYANLDRYQGDGTGPSALDFEISGLNFLGFRAGAQWEYALSEEGNQRVQVGALYRHKTVTTLESDKGTALFAEYEDVSMKFTLPSRFGFGGRYDVYDAAIAVDAEYGLNSQNDGYPLKGTDSNGNPLAVGNYFRWSDAWTVRTGLEYRLLESRLPIRIGYIWDQKTTNERFPSAFGTPPGPSHIETIGCGWNAGTWQVNFAYAHRRAKGEVTTADLIAGTAELAAEGKTPCQFCGGAGDYDLTLHGIYLDASYDF
jgi:long-subunit fatty acid transport protein